MEFMMKDLDQTKFYLGLQLEHLPMGTFVRLYQKDIGDI
jgi:hypothetical protein